MKKKRKYTFRKNRPFPVESGSIDHMAEKAHKEIIRKAEREEEKFRKKLKKVNPIF